VGAAFSGIRLAAEGKTTDEKFVAPIVHTTTWFQNAGVKLHVGIQIDGLAVLLMFVVTTVSLLVHYYSTEYLHGDRRFNHYFAALSLFTASMLLLVVASSTLELLMGWELVGLSSTLLVVYYQERQAPARNALWLWTVYRVSDAALLLAAVVLHHLVDAAAVAHAHAAARLHAGIDVSLRHRRASLDRSPGFDREGRSREPNQRGGCKDQTELPHDVLLDLYGERLVRLMTTIPMRVQSFRELQIS